MDIKTMIYRKLTSAQWVITILITATYCLSIIACLMLVAKGKLTINEFLGIFTAFSTIAATVVTSYFRRDRTPPSNEENK